MKNPERPTAPPMATKIGYTCERARVWSVDRFIHSRVTAPRTRRDGTTERRIEGRKERTKPSPGPCLSVSLTTNGRSARVRSSFATNPPPRSVYTRRRDERRTTDDDAPLGEANAERTTCRIETRLCSLASQSRRASGCAARGDDRRVRSSPRRGREGVHLGSRIGES